MLPPMVRSRCYSEVGVTGNDDPYNRATYHRSATARDRDMLREQVLRGLG